ncbi:hypothetical protein [Paracoccus albicereus]|uniref:hypothetical protein n=1 Tax=Paracoccus albicereus TaxID=2922394 RepID=UPI002101A61F|nr:hypothetical protein [Paracoccus albicereus]
MADTSEDRHVPQARAAARRAPRDEGDTRNGTDAARGNSKPAVSRANEIVRSIGLTPIRGRSGPRIAY